MFGSDGSPIVQYVAIFAVIFAVLTVIVLGVRRLGGGGIADARRAGQRGRQPRLGIVDVYELDRQRQLILLRRDNVEHLLLVGGPNDVVIERHIQRGPAPRPDAMVEPLPEPLSEPLRDRFADAANPAFPGLETRAGAAFQPNFAMPVVLPPAVPGSGAVPPTVHPLDAAILDPERVPDSIVLGPRPDTPARRPMRRTAPPLINPRPDVASERPRAEAPPDAPAFAAVAMPPMVASERRTVDPAILSDMARQLEAALARPASAVTPPPPARPLPAPEPAPETPAPIDPMAAAMSAPVEPPAVRAAEPEASPAAEVPAAEMPAPPAPEPSPFLPEPPPAPVAPPPEVPPQVEAPAKAEPPPKPAANPFSVEEIEAEFARLLGRPLDKRN